MSTQDPVRDAAVTSEGGPSTERQELTEPSGSTSKRGLMIGGVVLGAVVLGALLMSMLQSAPTTSAVESSQTISPSETNPVLPASPPKVDGLRPREGAGALRRDATQACKAAQWQRCRNDVEQAALLDPEGDKVGPVQRLHRAAEQGHF
jgi:hypothetical protein